MGGRTGTGGISVLARESVAVLEYRVNSLLGNDSNPLVRHEPWEVCPTDDNIRLCCFNDRDELGESSVLLNTELRRIPVQAQNGKRAKALYVLHCEDIPDFSLSSRDYRPLATLGNKVFGTG